MDEPGKAYQLNEYLKELAEGELKLERVADPEIASLLKLAEHLQENLLVASSPHFRKQTREETLAAWQKRRLNQRRRLAKIITLAAAFLLLLSSLASATLRSKPGSLLYPVKRVLQKMVTFVSEPKKPKVRAEQRPESRKEQDKRVKPKNKKLKEKPKGKRENRGRRKNSLLLKKTNFHSTFSHPSSDHPIMERRGNKGEEEDTRNLNKEGLEAPPRPVEPEKNSFERGEEERD